MCSPARTSTRRFAPRSAGLVLALTLTAPLGAAAAPAHAAPSPGKPAATGKADHRTSFGERSIKVAARYRGVPYRSGGTTPRGFDCSGFTRYVYGKLHKRIPRSSQQQFNAADRVKRPRVGDLIFYHSGRGGSVYHVAIYAGGRKVWHSTRPGERVRKTRIHTSSWTAGRY